jgi:hypothetical protein
MGDSRVIINLLLFIAMIVYLTLRTTEESRLLMVALFKE